MKKFSKITLIIAAVFAIVGLTLCTTAISIGGGINELRNLAKSGNLNFGNWHFEDGVYYRGENMLDVVDELEVDFDLLPAGTESATGNYSEQISRIDMDLDIANVQIRVVDTDTLNVTMENGYEKYYTEKLNGDTLEITYDVGMKTFKDGPDITINVPARYELDEIVIDTDLGNVEIRGFEHGIGYLNVKADLGNIEVSNCLITGDSILEADMGNAQMTDVTCQNVELNSDMGEVSFKGTVNGDLTMEADMGSATAEILGKESDYNVCLSADMGEVTCSGHRYHKDMGGEYETNNAGAKGDIYMHSSMGAVELSFR